MKQKVGLLLLLLTLALAQAPIPRPRPPEEPKPTWILRVEIAKGDVPLPKVLIQVQEISPNRLPIRQGLPSSQEPMVRWSCPSRPAQSATSSCFIAGKKT